MLMDRLCTTLTVKLFIPLNASMINDVGSAGYIVCRVLTNPTVLRTNQIADWSTRGHHAYSVGVNELTRKMQSYLHKELLHQVTNIYSLVRLK